MIFHKIQRLSSVEPNPGGLILPFLNKKNVQQTGVSMKMREPDESEESKDSGSEAIEAAAQDLIQAIQAQDVKAVAKALQAAYDICESSDSESDSEIEPHSYDSQKED